MEPRLLYRVRLTGAHKPTGTTRHISGGGVLPAPIGLRIVRYEGDAGFYLFYDDETGNEQTDTWHESVARAMGQAEFEFRVRPDEWTLVEPP